MSVEREALEAIAEKHRRTSSAWRPARERNEIGQSWHDGFVTALAECSILARRGLDPEGYEESEKLWRDSGSMSDREWFDRTGMCGHCGMRGNDCVCTEDDPCSCGPHEPRTWPIACYVCDGTGVQEPRVKRDFEQEELPL